jgi:hypothetical protein
VADLSVAIPRTFSPQSADAAVRTSAPAETSSRRWMRPAAYGSAVLFGVFTGFAIQQALSARQSDSDADAMVGPGGALAPGSDPSRYSDLRSDARTARRHAYVSAGAAVVFAATAAVLGWKSRASAEVSPGALALQF